MDAGFVNPGSDRHIVGNHELNDLLGDFLEGCWYRLVVDGTANPIVITLPPGCLVGFAQHVIYDFIDDCHALNYQASVLLTVSMLISLGARGDLTPGAVNSRSIHGSNARAMTRPSWRAGWPLAHPEVKMDVKSAHIPTESPSAGIVNKSAQWTNLPEGTCSVHDLLRCALLAGYSAGISTLSALAMISNSVSVTQRS